MSAQALSIPNAPDLEISDIHPLRELESVNHLLDDHAALMRFYDENGYILLRNVLSPASIARARQEMFAVLERHGAIAPGDTQGVWTGKPFPGDMEESAEFSGISKRLVEDPANLKLMEKILGEPACMVPNVQYRAYAPGSAFGRVHQDGFYSPGIQDYKPVWITLTDCDRKMGGLALAVGQNKRGYFHNLAKPPTFSIPRDAIPADSWATTDYRAGDALIVHPYTPHTGMPNGSNRFRVSFDTRVQSAKNPSAVAATVKSVTPNSITVQIDERGEKTFNVDKECFIRVRSPGVREKFEDFANITKPGMRLIVVSEGNRAVMLRKAAEG